MAVYTVMTWNTWQTGYKDYGADGHNYQRLANAPAFFNHAAAVIANCGANIVALQEIYNQAGEVVLFSLCDALRYRTDQVWYYLPPLAAGYGGNTECYGYLWRDGAGIAPAIDPTKPAPQAGSLCTTNALCGLGSNNYPTNTGALVAAGSRRAAYAVFGNVAGAPNPVIVTNYHAPSKITGALAGLTALAMMPELAGVPGLPPLTACILCGDYNVDYETKAVDYDHQLQNPTGTVQSTMNRTSLATNNPTIAAAQPVNSDAYTSSAYDNIFVTALYSPANNGAVIDLIAENRTLGNLADQAKDYLLLDANGHLTFQYANVLAKPFDTTYKSFILTRYAISDHLPVTVTVVTP